MLSRPVGLSILFIIQLGNAGYVFRRYPSTRPTVVSKDESIDDYTTKTFKASSENICSYKCGSNYESEGCLSVYFNRTTKLCTQFWVPFKAQQVLKLETSSIDDISFDLSLEYGSVKPKLSNWLPPLNATKSNRWFKFSVSLILF